MSEALRELAAHIETRRPNDVLASHVAFGELTLEVVASHIAEFSDFLRMDAACRFSSLVDITAVDHPTRERRFDVVYHFQSMYQNHRIRVKAAVREDEICPSITSVYPAANKVQDPIMVPLPTLASRPSAGASTPNIRPSGEL